MKKKIGLIFLFAVFITTFLMALPFDKSISAMELAKKNGVRLESWKYLRCMG